MNQQLLTEISRRAAGKARTVVFAEAATDEQTLRAAALVLERGWGKPVLLGRRDDFNTSAEALGLNVRAAQVINPSDDPATERIVTHYQQKNKGEGLTADRVRAMVLADPVLYGAGLVALGAADALIAGSSTPIEGLLAASKKLIGNDATTSFSVVSLAAGRNFGMDGTLVFTDCEVVADPTDEQLAACAQLVAGKAAELLPGFQPKVAMLSFSTKGSASHERVDKVVRATAKLKEAAPGLVADGEMQADAAIVASVCAKKAKDSPLGGAANVLVFPDLDSANASLGLVRKLGGASVYGPFLQGLGRVVAGVPRRAGAEEIARTCALAGS